MKLLTCLCLLFYLNLSAQATWQPLANIVSNTNNQRFDDVFFINDQIGWAANGFYARVYKTTNGGETWTNLSIGSNLNRIFIINETLAYASGTSLYKFTEETLGNEIVLESGRTSLNITLKNNPVASYLEFDIAFDSDDNLLIELYDLNGKFIKQLSRNIIPNKTTKNYKFSTENLSSGTYILNLHNNTGRESIKFIKK